MPRYVMDTHVHSKASDGCWRPAEVVEHAKREGLQVIALTDHDTVFGIDEAVAVGKRIGVRVIPGIEIDAEYRGSGREAEAHVDGIEVLGLHIVPERLRTFVNRRARQSWCC